MVAKTWLVQNDEAIHGGDVNKLTFWRWLSSSGRMNKSSVASRRKLERLTMRVEGCCFVEQPVLDLVTLVSLVILDAGFKTKGLEWRRN